MLNFYYLLLQTKVKLFVITNIISIGHHNKLTVVSQLSEINDFKYYVNKSL